MIACQLALHYMPSKSDHDVPTLIDKLEVLLVFFRHPASTCNTELCAGFNTATFILDVSLKTTALQYDAIGFIHSTCAAHCKLHSMVMMTETWRLLLTHECCYVSE
jgi:hypothetical protein